MKSNLEVELKYGLPDPGALLLLQKELGGIRENTLQQVNHFFVPADAGKIPFALRLREENQCFILTVKGRQQQQGTLTIRIEEEVQISATEATAIFSDKLNPLKCLLEHRPVLIKSEFGRLLAFFAKKVPHWKQLGSFRNERITYLKDFTLANEPPLALRLEYDSTYFSADNITYELEIELPAAQADEINKFITATLNKLNLPFLLFPSKYQRFLSYNKLQ